MTYKSVSNITDLNDCNQIKNHNNDICTTTHIELKENKNAGKHQNIIIIRIFIIIVDQNFCTSIRL